MSSWTDRKKTETEALNEVFPWIYGKLKPQGIKIRFMQTRQTCVIMQPDKQVQRPQRERGRTNFD